MLNIFCILDLMRRRKWLQHLLPMDLTHLRELLAETEKSVLSDRIGMIDVRSEQNIQMNCDGAYRLTFGSGADAGLKLRMANKTISDSLFETGMLARIDLSVTGVASVQYDLRLDLSAVD